MDENRNAAKMPNTLPAMHRNNVKINEKRKRTEPREKTKTGKKCRKS